MQTKDEQLLDSLILATANGKLTWTQPVGRGGKPLEQWSVAVQDHIVLIKRSRSGKYSVTLIYQEMPYVLNVGQDRAANLLTEVNQPLNHAVLTTEQLSNLLESLLNEPANTETEESKSDRGTLETNIKLLERSEADYVRLQLNAAKEKGMDYVILEFLTYRDEDNKMCVTSIPITKSMWINLGNLDSRYTKISVIESILDLHHPVPVIKEVEPAPSWTDKLKFWRGE